MIEECYIIVEIISDTFRIYNNHFQNADSYMNKKGMISFLTFEDVINQNPNYDPYVILEGYKFIQPDAHKKLAMYGEYISISSLMIPKVLRDRALDEIDNYSLPTFSGGSFEYDENGKRIYDTGESWNYHEGLIVEPLVINRFWPGLNISFIEPMQRLILYLNLLLEGDTWIDPYNKEEIIKIKTSQEYQEEVEYRTKTIEIKIDYLKDYLAARNSGLLVMKYSERGLIFNDENDIPDLESNKEIPHGRWNFYSSKNASDRRKDNWAETELRQKFWIDPFPEPRRDDAHPRGEFVGGVLFTLQDGTKKEFDVPAGHKGDYFKLISFRPDIMEVFTSRPHFDYEDYTKETIGFKFPNGESLAVAINPSGQIQSWWGQIAKLSKMYQQILAPYSESWKQKIPEDHEYWRTTIEGNFPISQPIKSTIQEKKTEINYYFHDKFGEMFFNSDSSEADLKKVFEPYNKDPYQLLDMMEQLDKWLFSEKRPGTIIESFNLTELLENPDDVQNIKSLVSLELLLTKYYGKEEAKQKCNVLRLIKDLRVCKAHYKNLSTTYAKYGLEKKSPREIYKMIMHDLETFLDWLYGRCKEDVFKIQK